MRPRAPIRSARNMSSAATMLPHESCHIMPCVDEAPAEFCKGLFDAPCIRRSRVQRLYEEKLKVTLGAPPQPPSPVMEASETAELLNSAETTNVAQKAAGAATGAISRDMPVSLDDYKTENRKLREQLALAELRSTEMSAKVWPGAPCMQRVPHSLDSPHLPF